MSRRDNQYRCAWEKDTWGNFVDWFWNFLSEMLIAILGIALFFGGYFINEMEDKADKLALDKFLDNISYVLYSDYDVSYFCGDKVNVTIESVPERYGVYKVDATAGNYNFEGLIEGGKFKKEINFSKNEEFWDKGTMLCFAGEVIAILGLLWFIFKRSMNIKSVRDIDWGNLENPYTYNGR